MLQRIAATLGTVAVLAVALVASAQLIANLLPALIALALLFVFLDALLRRGRR